MMAICHDEPRPDICRGCKVRLKGFAAVPRLKSGRRVDMPALMAQVKTQSIFNENRFDWSSIPADDIGPMPAEPRRRARTKNKPQTTIQATSPPQTQPKPESNGNMKYTIGMATYDDFDGVYFTIQSLRMFHNMDDVEIVVVDNFGCDFTRDLIEHWVENGRYIKCTNITSTAIRDRIFHEAAGTYVMCLDCHVMLMPNAVERWKRFYDENPGYMGLMQGPMMHDNVKGMDTHLDPVWRGHMYGTWGFDERGHGDELFDIPMQGLGLFACRKDAWLGFNSRFRGFGGEEGYIHEKFRQAGRPVQCAPWLKWMHRFGRPYSAGYPLNLCDRVKNYLIGFTELGLDIGPIFKHFNESMPEEHLIEIANETIGEGPYAEYFKDKSE